MSTFRPHAVACPSCAHSVEVHLLEGMHITRIPDVRAAILAGRFHTFTCPACGDSFVIEVPAIYTDFPAGQYVAVEVGEPVDLAPSVGRHQRVFDECFTLGPPAAQELALTMRTRLVYGYPALREKLLVWDAGLDDRVVESLKGSWFEREGIAPASERLRVVAVLDGGHLLCARLEPSVRGSPGAGEVRVVDLPRIRGFHTLLAQDYQRHQLRRAETAERWPHLGGAWLVDVSLGG